VSICVEVFCRLAVLRLIAFILILPCLYLCQQLCHPCYVTQQNGSSWENAPAGELKVTDFGLARTFGSPGRGYTNQVDVASCHMQYKCDSRLTFSFQISFSKL